MAGVQVWNGDFSNDSSAMAQAKTVLDSTILILTACRLRGMFKKFG